MALLTEHAEIEYLGNGREQQAIGIAKIAYRRNGNLTRILDLIGNTGDPNLPLGVDELVQFRARDRLAGNSPMAHFGRGKSHIKWTWLGTNNVNGQPSGNTQLFRNAWNGADLRMAIAGHILHDDAPLYTGHPRTFSLRLDAHQNFDLDTLSSEEFRVLDPVLLGPQMQSIPLSWVKSMQGGKRVLSVTLPDGDFAGWTLDPTITLQPDATDGIDTWLSLFDPTGNYGANAFVLIGETTDVPLDTYRWLVQFNLSSIPDNAIISSSTLSLYCTQNKASNARTFRIYRQKRAWVEAQATWNVYSTGNSWQTAGGFGANDCEQDAIGSRDFVAAETLNEFKDFSLTGTSKAALDLGNGWMAMADTELNDSHTFSSSNNATAANRPKLVEEYTVPVSGHFRFQGWRRV